MAIELKDVGLVTTQSSDDNQILLLDVDGNIIEKISVENLIGKYLTTLAAVNADQEQSIAALALGVQQNLDAIALISSQLVNGQLPSLDPKVVNLSPGGMSGGINATSLNALYDAYEKTVEAPPYVPQEVKDTVIAMGMASNTWCAYVGGGVAYYNTNPQALTWNTIGSTFGASLVAVFTFVA